MSKKAIVWYRYRMYMVRVECPNCGADMYSIEPEIWACENCTTLVHDEDLEWKLFPKEG